MRRHKKNEEALEEEIDLDNELSLDDTDLDDDEPEIVEVGADQRLYEEDELRRQGYGDNGLDYDLYEAAEG